MAGPVIVAMLVDPGAGNKYSQGDALYVLPEGQGPGGIPRANVDGRYAFIEVTDAGAGQAGVDAVLATGVLEIEYEVAIHPDTGEDEGGPLKNMRKKGNSSVGGWPPGQVAKAKDWNRKVQVTLAQLTGALADKV